MNRFSLWLCAALAAAGSAALALGLAGCSKKITSVDPAYTTIEGTPSTEAQILAQNDVPIDYIEYFDRLGVGGPIPVDTLFYTPYDTLFTGQVRQATYTLYANSPGAVGGIILDHTVASGYQVLRRESNGGFRNIHDFMILPTRRWLDSEWEAYLFDDPSPSSFHPATYQGRGYVSKAITAASPLTNRGLVTGAFVDTLHFDYQGFIDTEELPDSTYTPPDSIFGMHWGQVPSAAGYWIQIFQFTGNSFEQIRSSLPAPLYLRSSRDYFVGFVPAPADSYRIGGPGALVLTRRPIINHQEYFARITAVDATGQLLAHSYGRPTRVPGPVRNTWEVFWRGAIKLRPGPKKAAAPFSRVAAGFH